MKKIDKNFIKILALSGILNAILIKHCSAWDSIDYNISGGDVSTIASSIFSSISGVLAPIMGVLAIVGIIGIVYGGLLYSTAGASPNNAAKGKKAITNALIGTIICVGGRLLLSAIYQFTKQAASDPTSIITSLAAELAAWTGAISVIMVVFGALQYTMGGANPAQAAKGKQTIIFACIGIAIAVAAWAILSFVTGLI